MQLYTLWRAQAPFRVRIALGLKRIEAEMVHVDLVKAAQTAPAYRKLNPSMLLPTLIDGDGPPLVQSLAIIEYLDEIHPDPPLLPKAPRDRAHVRALAQTVAIEAHPLVVPRVRNYLQDEFHIDEAGRMRWMKHWLDHTTMLVEQMLSNDARTGRFCCGDSPTLADVCLIPHMWSAQILYDYDFGSQPTMRRILNECMKLPAFTTAHPRNQADAPARA